MADSEVLGQFCGTYGSVLRDNEDREEEEREGQRVGAEWCV